MKAKDADQFNKFDKFGGKIQQSSTEKYKTKDLGRLEREILNEHYDPGNLSGNKEYYPRYTKLDKLPVSKARELNKLQTSWYTDLGSEKTGKRFDPITKAIIEKNHMLKDNVIMDANDHHKA